MEYNKTDPQYKKMLAFIEKLLLNKSFEKLSVVKKEDYIIDFFKKNELQLKPTFQSQAYYPELEWEEIQILFFTVLRDYVIDTLSPKIESLIEQVNFAVVRVVAEGPLDDYKAQITEFYKKILSHKEVRSDFDTLYNAFYFGYIEKYLELFKIRRGYGSLELFKYKQLQNMDDYANFFKICMFLRNVLKVRIPLQEGRQVKNVNYESVTSSPFLKHEFLKKIEALIKTQFPHLPELFYNISINSAIDLHEEAKHIDIASKFLKIIAERCKDAKAFDKIDKGAETPDKSWFSIARKNYLYYGFDLKLLDEFYIIASENRW